jgi:hypothetical protein
MLPQISELSFKLGGRTPIQNHEHVSIFDGAFTWGSYVVAMHLSYFKIDTNFQQFMRTLGRFSMQARPSYMLFKRSLENQRVEHYDRLHGL